MDWEIELTGGEPFGYADGTPKRVGSGNAKGLAEMRRLSKRIDYLTLACHSMWELLRDHSELTEEDLERKILEVNLRDGVADGKMSPKILVCDSCGKNTNSKRSSCIICGAPVKQASQFE